MPRFKYHKRSLAAKLRRQKQFILYGKSGRGFLKLELPEDKVTVKQPPAEQCILSVPLWRLFLNACIFTPLKHCHHNCIQESGDTEFALFQIPIEDENLEETQEDTQLTVQSLLVHLEQTSEESPSEAKEDHLFKTQQELLEETIEEEQKLEEPQEDKHTVQCLVPSESPSDAKESHLFKVQELIFFPEDLDLFHETTA